jgi:hypothetical protein
MKSFIIFLIMFISSFIFAQNNNQEWTTEELQSAKTGDTCSFLEPIEKDVVMYLNLARMYPKKFKVIELKGYYGTKKYGDYLKGSPYITSLEEMLDTLVPMNALIPSDSMTSYSKCFAKEMGASGTVGHERINCPKINKYAENCSFGMTNGKDIVMQMLIDHNIVGLGHRINSLNPRYLYIGVAFDKHKEWGECCVMNLYKP